MPKRPSETDKEVDCQAVARGVWLVKVPKYISDQWENTKDTIHDAGSLEVRQVGNSQEITFTLNEEKQPDVNQTDNFPKNELSQKSFQTTETIPRYHKFTPSNIEHQTMVVFSEEKSEGEPNKLKIEGFVSKKGDCRPVRTETYMNLKKNNFLKDNKPLRTTRPIGKMTPNNKPVANRKHNVAYEPKKKVKDKNYRHDKTIVTDKLFNAFAKHQYYNFKDLVNCTEQPAAYLKEILEEIANFNLSDEHPRTWELKPEYHQPYKKE